MIRNRIYLGLLQIFRHGIHLPSLHCCQRSLVATRVTEVLPNRHSITVVLVDPVEKDEKRCRASGVKGDIAVLRLRRAMI